MKYTNNIRGLSSRFLILFLFLMSSQIELSGQCPVNVACPNGLRAPNTVPFCNGPNPNIIRDTLGWGIIYNPATDTYNYTNEKGDSVRIPSHYGLIRTIHVRVPFPNRGRKDPQWLYFSKQYYYNITDRSRLGHNSKITPRVNNSCWTFHEHQISSGLYDLQQKAFSNGAVTGLTWIAGLPTGICMNQNIDNRDNQVADRPIYWTPMFDLEIINDSTTANRPCVNDGNLCIQLNLSTVTNPTLPVVGSGVLEAWKMDGTFRIIATVPLNFTTGRNLLINVPYVIAENEKLNFRSTLTLGATLSTEFPAQTGLQKSVRTGNPNYVRSPDNICLIADNNGDGVWDDFPQPGIDY